MFNEVLAVMYSRTCLLPRRKKLKISYLYVSTCLCFGATLRALDILSDEVLVELSAAYRRMVSHPASRNHTTCITLSNTVMFTYCYFSLLLFFSPSIVVF